MTAKDGMLPADAGIGSNDPGALGRAGDAPLDTNTREEKPSRDQSVLDPYASVQKFDQKPGTPLSHVQGGIPRKFSGI